MYVDRYTPGRHQKYIRIRWYLDINNTGSRSTLGTGGSYKQHRQQKYLRNRWEIYIHKRSIRSTLGGG